MNRTQFTFYESFFRAVSCIKKAADRAQAYDLICRYALYGDEPDTSGLPDSVAVAFEMVKPNLASSRRKATSGKKGGEQKQTGSKPEANAKQTGSKGNSEARDTTKQEQEKEQEKEQVQDKEQMLSPFPPSAEEGKEPRFKKPTLEEVRAYCRDRKNSVDPQKWYDHYTSNGWKVGKNPMADWKAAVRTWERSEINKPQTGFQTSNPFMEMLQEEGGNLF